MKKIIILAAFLSSLLHFSLATAANNECIKNIAAHQMDGDLDLSNCNLSDNDLNAVNTYVNFHPAITLLILLNNNIGPNGAAIIAKNRNIQILWIHHNHIGNTGLLILANDPKLVSLDANDNQITDDSMQDLRKILATKPALIDLGLANNQITAKGIAELAQIKTLQNIELSGNPIGDDGAKLLAQNSNAYELFLVNNGIHDAGAMDLANDPNLGLLDLETSDTDPGQPNSITYIGATALATQSQNLSALDLDGNAIGLEGTDALVKNPALTILSLNNNKKTNSSDKLGSEGAAILAKSTTLQQLAFDSNNIGSDGAGLFAKNNSLSYLSLESNKIDDMGASTFSTNTNLRQLDLASNNITEKGTSVFRKTDHYETIDLSNNNIGDTGAANIAKAGFFVFYASHCQIGDAGANALAKSDSLMALDVSKNHIGPAGIAALKADEHLQLLNIDDQSKPTHLHDVFSFRKAILKHYCDKKTTSRFCLEK